VPLLKPPVKSKSLRGPLFHIQKPAVFEYEKVNFPGFRIDTKERTRWLKGDDGELR
jgi:hypothetical protein